MEIFSRKKDIEIERLKKLNRNKDKEIKRLINLCKEKDKYFNQMISDGLRHGSKLASKHMKDKKRLFKRKVI